MLGSTLIMELIFFTKEIKPFKAKSGVTVSPCPCELKDGREGYFLGIDWKDEIEAKTQVELISKDDLKQNELI